MDLVVKNNGLDQSQKLFVVRDVRLSAPLKFADFNGATYDIFMNHYTAKGGQRINLNEFNVQFRATTIGADGKEIIGADYQQIADITHEHQILPKLPNVPGGQHRFLILVSQKKNKSGSDDVMAEFPYPKNPSGVITDAITKLTKVLAFFQKNGDFIPFKEMECHEAAQNISFLEELKSKLINSISGDSVKKEVRQSVDTQIELLTNAYQQSLKKLHDINRRLENVNNSKDLNNIRAEIQAILNSEVKTVSPIVAVVDTVVESKTAVAPLQKIETPLLDDEENDEDEGDDDLNDEDYDDEEEEYDEEDDEYDGDEEYDEDEEDEEEEEEVTSTQTTSAKSSAQLQSSTLGDMSDFDFN